MALEKWAPLPAPYDGFEGYRISDSGVFYSPRSKSYTNGGKHGGGYLMATIRSDDGTKKVVGVHRLVGLAFVEGRTDQRNSINHKDGVKANNHYSNLEWMTLAENTIHAWKNGLVKGTPGNPGAANLTDAQVSDALSKFAKHGSLESLSKELSLSTKGVLCTLHGDTWAHIERPFDSSFVKGLLKARKPRGNSHSNTKLSEGDLNVVRQELAKGTRGSVLAARYGVSRALISQIKNKKARL